MTLKNGLNERQKEAVEHLSGPLLIIAGAGAGKTKTITYRIANLISQGVPAHSILAVTFTNKAAGEMRERVQNLLGDSGSRPFISTFHALSVRLLREFSTEAGIERSFVIWDRDDSIRALKKIAKELDVDEPRGLLNAISREKGKGVTQDEYATRTKSWHERTVAAAWEKYDKVRTEEGALDFDDLLLYTLRLLQGNEQVRTKLRRRWTHIHVDEYQDTNAVQYEIMCRLVGDDKNICVVGDTDQLLYSWRGARIENLLGFESSFPGTKTVLLEQNYRSTQTILTAANAVIERNKNRHPKRLFTANETGEAIEVYGAPDERAEARYIATEARALLNSGTKPSDIAVLYRENFQSRVLEEACIEQGLPYRVLGTQFFERTEVKTVLAYLRASMNPKSTNDLSRIVSSPPRGIGAQTLEKMLAGNHHTLSGAARIKVENFMSLLSRIQQAVHTLPASQAVRFVLTESGLEKHFKEGTEEDKERLENAYELVSLSTKYDTLPPPTGIEMLLEDAALMTDQDSLAEKREAISLMTVHASKGLEFDAVFVTGLEQGLFPSLREGGGERDPEEERRLFYVALTRARKFLHLTYAASRARYGQRDFSLPSEFLDDIDRRLINDVTPAAPIRRGGILDSYEDEIR